VNQKQIKKVRREYRRQVKSAAESQLARKAVEAYVGLKRWRTVSIVLIVVISLSVLLNIVLASMLAV
jgi:ElaB/YqjD/DUF883 family membrane-anchored ribosome-binding protein